MIMSTELMQAIIKCDQEKVRELVNATPELRTSIDNDKERNTILLIAIYKSSPEFIKFVIENGYGNLDEINKTKQNCAHAATYRGDINIIKYIYGLKPNIFQVMDMGYSCLHLAAAKGDIEVLDFFLANNVGILAGKGCGLEEEHGMSPLLSAVIFNKVSMVKHLLTKPGVTLQDKNGKTGQTAFELAAKKNNTEMLAFLTEATLEMLNKIRVQILENRRLQENIEQVKGQNLAFGNNVAQRNQTTNYARNQEAHLPENNEATQDTILEVSLFDEDEIISGNSKPETKPEAYQVVLPEIIEPVVETVTSKTLEDELETMDYDKRPSLIDLLKKLEINPDKQVMNELFKEKEKFLTILVYNIDLAKMCERHILDLQIFLKKARQYTDPNKFKMRYQPLDSKAKLTEESIKFMCAYIYGINKAVLCYQQKQINWEVYTKALGNSIEYINRAYVVADKSMNELVNQMKIMAQLESRTEDDLKSSVGHPLYKELVSFSNDKRAYFKHILTTPMNFAPLHDAQGYSLIHIAIALHQGNLAEYLMSKPETNINESNHFTGEHTLSIAAKHGHFEMVILLLKHGVYIDFPFSKGALRGMTTKQMVNLTKYGINTLPLLNAAEKLIELAVVRSKDTKIIQECINTLGEGLNARRMEDGNTALHIAIKSGNDTLVKMLLDNNASIHIPNAKGIFPWETAQNSKNHYMKALTEFKMLAFVTQNYPLQLFSKDTSLIRFINSVENQNTDVFAFQYEPQGNDVPQIPFEGLLQILFKTLMDSVKLCEVPKQNELYFEIGCYFAQSDHRAFNPAAAYSILMQVGKSNPEQYKMAQTILYTLSLNYPYISKVLTPPQPGSQIPVQLPATKIKVALNEAEHKSESELSIESEKSKREELNLKVKTDRLLAIFTHFRESNASDEAGIYHQIAQFTGIPSSGSRLMLSPYLGFDIKGIAFLTPDAQTAIESLNRELRQQASKLKHELETGSSLIDTIDDHDLLLQQYERSRSNNSSSGKPNVGLPLSKSYKSKV